MNYNDVERLLQFYGTLSIQNIELRFSMDLNLYRMKEDIFTSVYGIESGSKEDTKSSFKGVITGDDFNPYDKNSIAQFKEGYLYTTSTLPKPGDQIGIVRSDGKERRYKLERPTQLGMTEKIFNRFNISAIGE